jgi:cytochrome d ubiquinol oxidase subunit I
MVDGRAQLTSIWAVLTNNTALYAFAHTILAALLTGGMAIAGISAWHLLRKSNTDVFRSSMRLVLPVIAVAGVLTVGVGHFNGVLMSEQQPMKMAAADAVFETTEGAGLSLFAVGSMESNPEGLSRNIEVPNLLSFVMTGFPRSEVQGINDLNREYQQRFGPGEYAPIVAVAYWSWRLMLGIGFALVAFGFAGLWLMRKDRLESSRRFLKVSMWMGALPIVASLSGWTFTEMGRQPWTVFGMLQTSDSVSPTVPAYEVWISLIGFTLLYGVLAVIAGRIFFKTAGKGPVDEDPDQDPESAHLGLAY